MKDKLCLILWSSIISAMQNGSLMMPSHSDTQHGSIYLFKLFLHINPNSFAESQVMPIMKNSRLSLKICKISLCQTFGDVWLSLNCS